MSSLSRKNTPTEGYQLRISRKHVAESHFHGSKCSVRLGVYRQTIRSVVLAMDAITIYFDLIGRWHYITFVSST